MQSATRFALPYTAVPAARLAAPPQVKRSRVVSYLRSILPGLLVVYDATAVLVSGISADLLDCVCLDGFRPLLGRSVDEMTIAAVLGGVVSPILLGARPLRAIDGALVWLLSLRLLAVVAVSITMAAVADPADPVPFAYGAGWFGMSLALVLAGRAGAAATISWFASRFGGERIAVMGRGAEADWLRRRLGQASASGIELVPAGRRAGSMAGVVADLIEHGRDGALDRVIIAQPGLSAEAVRRIAHPLTALQVEVASLFLPPGAAAEPCRVVEIAAIPLFQIARRPQWGFGGLFKLAMDRCLALLLLLWMTPLLLLIAAAVRLDSPGPILFRQRRDGLNGVAFDIYKFRTMAWQGEDTASGAVQTGRGDKRITRLGALLRQSSLDEVPQLLNVLNGTMSLVGPRPHPVAMRTERKLGREITPDYAHRHRVKPGITGWAQINGLRGATETSEQLRRRIEHDNYYIENWSPLLDLRILALTPVSLLLRRDNAF